MLLLHVHLSLSSLLPTTYYPLRWVSLMPVSLRLRLVCGISKVHTGGMRLPVVPQYQIGEWNDTASVHLYICMYGTHAYLIRMDSVRLRLGLRRVFLFLSLGMPSKLMIADADLNSGCSSAFAKSKELGYISSALFYALQIGVSSWQQQQHQWPWPRTQAWTRARTRTLPKKEKKERKIIDMSIFTLCAVRSTCTLCQSQSYRYRHSSRSGLKL